MEAGEFDPQQKTTRSHATTSVLITGASQAVRLAVGFISGIVLARLLTPSDFGLIGMVAPAAALVAMTQDLGVGQAIVQRKTVTSAQISALFFLTLGASMVLAALLALAAPLLADFYGDDRIVAVTLGFSTLLVLWMLQSQPSAILARRMQFVSIASIEISSTLIGFFAAVYIAYVYQTYWAIFIQMLVTAVVNVAGIWIAARWVPTRPSFQGAFKEIMGLGAGISGSAFLNYLAQNIDKVLIGKFYGQETLGLYDRSYKLLLMPITQVASPLGRVFVPILSRLAGDGPRYRQVYTEAVTLMLSVTHPAVLVVLIFAEDVFRTLLGEHWVPAAPIFQWLGLCALHQVMLPTAGWLLFSQGRGGDIFRVGVIDSVVVVTAILVGLSWGAVGVAIALVIGDYLVRIPAVWSVVGKEGPVRVRDMVNMAVPHVAGCVAASAALIVTGRSLDDLTVVHFAGLFVLSYLVYGAVLVMWADKRMVFEKNVSSILATARRVF